MLMPSCRCVNTTILELKASKFFRGNLQQLAIITDNMIGTSPKDIDLWLMLSKTGSSGEARKRSEERSIEEVPVTVKKRKMEKIDV